MISFDDQQAEAAEAMLWRSPPPLTLHVDTWEYSTCCHTHDHMLSHAYSGVLFICAFSGGFPFHFWTACTQGIFRQKHPSNKLKFCTNGIQFKCAKGTQMNFRHQANLSQSRQEVNLSQRIPSVPFRCLLMLLGDSEG